MSAASSSSLAAPAKPLELQPFNPSADANIKCLREASMDPDCERAKRIRAECNKHIMSHALKHKEFNVETDIAVWDVGGKIVWTSPLVRAASKGYVKPLDRSAMPQFVLDATLNGTEYMGLRLPSCAYEEAKKVVRKKPTGGAAAASMPASDSLLDSIARRAVLVNGDAHADDDVAADNTDDLRASLIATTYQHYAGASLDICSGVARAGLFALHDSSKASEFVRGLLANGNIVDDERSPSDWVRTLAGKTEESREGEFTQQQAMLVGAAAVRDVATHLAAAAADAVAAAEKRATLAAANASALAADVAMYRERNTTLEAENAALSAQLAAATAKASAATANGDEPAKPKPARKRAPSNGAPSAKRAAAASAAAAPALPAAAVDDDEDNDALFTM